MVRENRVSGIIVFRPCRVTVLRPVLPILGPVVLLENHRPERTMEWWRTTVPLSASQRPPDPSAIRPPSSGKVRNLTYDLMMAAEEFAAVIDEVADLGADLYFFERAIAASLKPSWLKPEARDKILMQNSCRAHFMLPHAVETAVLRCYDGALFTALSTHAEVAPWVAERRSVE